MIIVTHDLEEAIYLADRVLMLPREKGAVPRLIEVDYQGQEIEATRALSRCEGF